MVKTAKPAIIVKEKPRSSETVATDLLMKILIAQKKQAKVSRFLSKSYVHFRLSVNRIALVFHDIHATYYNGKNSRTPPSCRRFRVSATSSTGIFFSYSSHLLYAASVDSLMKSISNPSSKSDSFLYLEELLHPASLPYWSFGCGRLASWHSGWFSHSLHPALWKKGKTHDSPCQAHWGDDNLQSVPEISCSIPAVALKAVRLVLRNNDRRFSCWSVLWHSSFTAIFWYGFSQISSANFPLMPSIVFTTRKSSFPWKIIFYPCLNIFHLSLCNSSYILHNPKKPSRPAFLASSLIISICRCPSAQRFDPILQRYIVIPLGTFQLADLSFSGKRYSPPEYAILRWSVHCSCRTSDQAWWRSVHLWDRWLHVRAGTSS